MNESRPHWKEVPGYEGLYVVSDQGTVMSLNYKRTGKRKELKPVKKSNGYQTVSLFRDGVGKKFTVHRIVWNAFNGDIPDGKEIDHINTIRDDNRLVNLRCVTSKENSNNPITYERNLETNKRMAQDPKWREAVRKARARPILQLDKETGALIREWECAMDVERELGVNRCHISNCCSGKLKSTGGYRWQFAPRRQKSTRRGTI